MDGVKYIFVFGVFHQITKCSLLIYNKSIGYFSFKCYVYEVSKSLYFMYRIIKTLLYINYFKPKSISVVILLLPAAAGVHINYVG